MHRTRQLVFIGLFLLLSLLITKSSHAISACPQLTCLDVLCPEGFAKDANGCNTCNCNTGPTSTVPTLGPGCYYKQVQCVRAPCNPVVVCPTSSPLSATPTPIKPTSPIQPSVIIPSGAATPSFAPANCPLQPKGDATCDGVVDASDYGAWKNVYLKKNIDTRFNPDFNNDHKVNLVDLEIWVRNLGLSTSVTPTTVVSGAPTSVVTPVVSATSAPKPTDLPDPTDIPLPSNTPGPSPTNIPVSGVTYYISPTGNDSNNGTSLTTPFKTFAKALPMLKPGDLLFMREGDYNENVKSVKTNPGTASAKITVKNYGSERPVVHGLFWMSGASYWVFDGINITWGSGLTSGDHMVKFTGNSEGWELKNCEIWGAHSYAGISITGFTNHWNINHCYIHDTYKSNDANQDHLIYANDASYGVIEHNVFMNSENGRGVKLGPPSGGGAGPNNIIIRYNTFYNNTGPANIQVSGGTSNNTFEKNILVKPASGQKNITVNNGYFGTNSVAKNNIGAQSSGVFESGIEDGGGNVTNIDPQINFNVSKRSDGSFIIDNSSFRPANSAAQSYGAFAP